MIQTRIQVVRTAPEKTLLLPHASFDLPCSWVLCPSHLKRVPLFDGALLYNIY